MSTFLFKRSRRQETGSVGTISRVTVAVYIILLTGSALGKVDGWRSWKMALPRLLPLPSPILRLLSVAVPTIELLVVAMLVMVPRVGLVAAGCLLGGLTFVAGALILRHKGESCACFGTIAESRIGPGLAMRNMALSIGALGGAFLLADVPEDPTLPAGELGALLLISVGVWVALEYRRMQRFAPPS